MNFKYPFYLQPNNYPNYGNQIPSSVRSQSMTYPAFLPIEMHQNITNTCNYMYPMNFLPYYPANMQHYNPNFDPMNPYLFGDAQKINQHSSNTSTFSNQNAYFPNHILSQQRHKVSSKYLNQEIDKKDEKRVIQNFSNSQKKALQLQSSTNKQKQKIDDKKSKEAQVIVIDMQEELIKEQFKEEKNKEVTQICEAPTKVSRKKKIHKQLSCENIIINEKRNRYPSSRIELEKSFLKNSLQIRTKRSKKVKTNADKNKTEIFQQIKAGSMPICLIKNSDNKIIMKIPQEIQSNLHNNSIHPQIKISNQNIDEISKVDNEKIPMSKNNFMKEKELKQLTMHNNCQQQKKGLDNHDLQV